MCGGYRARRRHSCLVLSSLESIATYPRGETVDEGSEWPLNRADNIPSFWWSIPAIPLLGLGRGCKTGCVLDGMKFSWNVCMDDGGASASCKFAHPWVVWIGKVSTEAVRFIWMDGWFRCRMMSGPQQRWRIQNGWHHGRHWRLHRWFRSHRRGFLRSFRENPWPAWIPWRLFSPDWMKKVSEVPTGYLTLYLARLTSNLCTQVSYARGKLCGFAPPNQLWPFWLYWPRFDQLQPGFDRALFVYSP